MPKGQYLRVVGRKDEWTAEEDTWLEVQCKAGISYGEMAIKYVEAFGYNVKRTRNSILGRAARKGFGTHKAHQHGKRGLAKVRKQVVVRKEPARPADERELRSDAEPLIRRSHPHMVRRATPEEIERRKLGAAVPCIVEDAPPTSVPFLETDGCKWPTSEDVRDLHVCGAPKQIGSYCTRHARMAFREMPTPRRNRSYALRGNLSLYHREDVS